MYGEANAACTPETGYNKVFKTVDIPMAVGRVVVRPTDEVGKVLRKATFPITPNGSTYWCDSYGGYLKLILHKIMLSAP